ncbi:MAG: ATP-dependent RecD-like DNA helicase [Chlamydia sp.]
MTAPYEEISGEVLRITYHDAETLFTVAKIQPQRVRGEREAEEVTIIGTIIALQIGHIVHCQGNWAQDIRHGKQFQVLKIRFELPRDPQSIQKLLSSKYIKGVGPKTAAKIVTAFGDQTFSILENESDKLFSIPGLSQKKAQEIIDLWRLHTVHEEILMLLLSWGLTHNQSLKALRQWGQSTLDIVKKNPYLLAQEIHGIGFIQADAIAKQIGFPLESHERISSAILYFLSEVVQKGHTAIPMTLFIHETQERLHVTRPQIEQEIASLLESKKIACVQKEGALFIAPILLHMTEKSLAHEIERIQISQDMLRKINSTKAIEWAETHFSMKFSDGQKLAIVTALDQKFSIITGGPGTGKSTIVKALLAILSYITKKISLVAPTGRAAKRLMEITKQSAGTIHRLLKIEKDGFFYRRSNQLSCDILIVDETSMVDTFLMNGLLQAIPNHTKVIFVGDVYQLPSIGPGTVLKDIIESSYVAVTYLTEIYRQSKRSQIIENAHRVHSGQMPWLKNFPHSDFLFFEAKEPNEVRQKTFELVTSEIPKRYRFDPRLEIQVLSPMKRGLCGIDQINSDLQSFFSKGEKGLSKEIDRRQKPRFLTGDKVIQLKNNYSKEIFNGDIGYILEGDADRSFSVQMEERIVEYDDTEELSLAWAVSVHKYQGSEAPCIVIPIHTQHFTLLNRNLLYTAITRGKKLVILIGSVKALAIAIKNTSGDTRWTFLQEALKDAYQNVL